MKRTIKKPGFLLITIVFWFLLLYMIAALSWWYIELKNQNKEMQENRLVQIKQQSSLSLLLREQAEKEFHIKNMQYLGEGITFLLVIIVGAVFVYRAVRNQFRLAEQQNNFMMAVTHELKTPIAILQLNLETIQKYQLDEVKKKNILDMSLLENHRLNDLTDNILVAAQLESGLFRKTKQEVDLYTLFHAALQEYTSRVPDRIFTVQLEEDLFVPGEPVLLKLVLHNLLSNAIKYSSKGSTIEVLVTKENQYAQLLIKDQGNGIPDAEKKRIFEKFYRVGNESTRSTKGTGLGLYLCKKIITGFGGKISVHNNINRGTIFKILLPLLQ